MAALVCTCDDGSIPSQPGEISLLKTAATSGHGPEGSCFALSEPRFAPGRRAALLLPAVLISTLLAAGGSTEEWDPSPLLPARPGGELPCTPRAPPRLRRAALLPPAVSIRSRLAAGLSTQEWDRCPPLRARPEGELLCTPLAPLPLQRAALLPPTVPDRSWRVTGLSTQEWNPCLPPRAPPGGELLCTPRAPPRPRLRQAALLPPAVFICIRRAAGRSTHEWDPCPPDSTTFLDFEWKGEFYRFVVLPFGLSTAPWLFTKVMSHCCRFLRSPGRDLGLLQYLDDSVFAAPTAPEALASGAMLVRILRRFGWLIHPTKCVGVTVAVRSFVALGTLVDLSAQTFSVPAAAVESILAAAHALASGPLAVPVRVVARLKGLVSATWLSTGVATRIRMRAFDAVIESRPAADGLGRRALRASWRATVTLSAACRAEALWWFAHLALLNGLPIRPRPYDSSVDGTVASDASDSGIGAVLYTDALGPSGSSIVRALLARAPEDGPLPCVLSYVRRGLEFMAALPHELIRASSTLRELYGIAVFVRAARDLLRGGRFRVLMDNLGCVFILGGVVPPFAVGGKLWGEYVSGGSPDPELQRLALEIFAAQLEYGFTLQASWVPRELNVRADYLSRVSTLIHHGYRILPSLFAWLDAEWGPHSIDRFATIDNRVVPRFCSHYFHPDAEWVDAFSVPWGEENNWLFPPVARAGQAVEHLRAHRAVGTLIVALAPWTPVRRMLQPRGRRWAPDVVATVRLGSPLDCLSIPRTYRPLFARCELFAVRLDGRLS